MEFLGKFYVCKSLRFGRNLKDFIKILMYSLYIFNISLALAIAQRRRVLLR